MFDVEKIRQDFPVLQNATMQGKPVVYLDNGATTLKPQCVIDAVVNYYSNLSANAHRGDYDLSLQVDELFEGVRDKVANLINCDRNEVIFTAGTTDSINMVAYGYGLTHLKGEDHMLLNFGEHASNTLPWFDVCDQTGCKIDYIELDDQGKVTLENVKKAVKPNTRLVAIAQVTNVLGYEIDLKAIIEYLHSQDIVVVVDGAQSVPHNQVDVQELDADFLAFSAHKMCGPTGVGVLYGKMKFLEAMKPIRYGGGSNARYDKECHLKLKDIPTRFESGTPNIAGVIGFGAAIDYLNEIGFANIHEHEIKLRQYAIDKLKQIDKVIIYNPDSTGPIAFNIKDVFAQDVASLFNKEGIAVRNGNHCAKILDNFLGVNQTLRASLYFYNTYEDIDRFVEVCKKGDDFLEAFF